MKQFLLLMAVANHGSIRRAADDLAVTQPAASKSLLEMEAALGVQLFERTHSGLVPTKAGSCAIEHARGMIGSLRRLKFDLDNIEHNRQGILRIGLIMGAVTGAFCDVVRRACESRHGLTVDAQEGTSAELMLKLQSGELDLVFARGGMLEGQPDIETIPLAAEPVCTAAGLQHPLESNRLYECSDLAKYAWVGYESRAPPCRPIVHLVPEARGAPARHKTPYNVRSGNGSNTLQFRPPCIASKLRLQACCMRRPH